MSFQYKTFCPRLWNIGVFSIISFMFSIHGLDHDRKSPVGKTQLVQVPQIHRPIRQLQPRLCHSRLGDLQKRHAGDWAWPQDNGTVPKPSHEGFGTQMVYKTINT